MASEVRGTPILLIFLQAYYRGVGGILWHALIFKMKTHISYLTVDLFEKFCKRFFRDKYTRARLMAFFIPETQYILARSRHLNLNFPKTFAEKMIYRRLYTEQLPYTSYVDKYRVREYVAKKIGTEHLIPPLSVHDNPKTINFDTLPKQFFIKTNHGCGYNVRVKDKNTFKRQAALTNLEKWLSQNYYYYSREKPYYSIQPKILIEKLLPFEEKSVDFKFYCFYGKTAFIQVVLGLADDIQTKECCYDVEWNLLPFTAVNPFYKEGVARSANLGLMVKLAEKLASGFDFVRVDLYNVKGMIYFGELTFFPCDGYVYFNPSEYGYKFGSMLNIHNSDRVDW